MFHKNELPSVLHETKVCLNKCCQDVEIIMWDHKFDFNLFNILL